MALIEFIETEESGYDVTLTTTAKRYNVAPQYLSCEKTEVVPKMEPRVDRWFRDRKVGPTASIEDFTERTYKSVRSNQPNWSRRHTSGEIIMSPYKVSRVVTRNYVATVYSESVQSSHRTCVDTTYYNDSKCGKPAGWFYETTSEDMVVLRNVSIKRITMANFGRLLGNLPIYEIDRSDLNQNLSSAKEDCIAACARKTLEFSPLTAFAERMESARTILGLVNAAKSPLRTYREMYKKYQHYARNNRRDKAGVAKASADLWLYYKYAILPLILDITSALNVAKNAKVEYQTDRASRRVSVTTEAENRDLNVPHIFELVEHNTRFTATMKSRYSNATSRVNARTSHNPIATAWEIVPFSFLVDWFISISDSIYSFASLFGSPGVSTKMCISTKTVESSTFYLYLPSKPVVVNVDSYSRSSDDGWRLQKRDTVIQPPGDPTVSRLRTIETEDFTRDLCQPTVVRPKFTFDTQSIGRLLTAFALKVKLTKSSLNKLKVK
uniref:Maturation protein n=1 Tax=Shahe levi-like virus 1 TaxID=1923426 RepID=A0A1L3KIN6_9VIRU|nr:hypothetical protein [Shahe levi-like virus 1]